MPTPTSRRTRRCGGRPPPLQDAFEPVGVRVGSFLLKPSIEVTRGYDTNPAHVTNGTASGFTMVEPALKLQSDWSRHEYGARAARQLLATTTRSRRSTAPLLDAKAVHAHRRVARHQRSTPKAGSSCRPTIRAARTCRPTSPSCRSSRPTAARVGLTQRFNHLELIGQGERRPHQVSGTPSSPTARTSSNHDRDFNQYGGAVRASYEVFPGVKPFVEVGADTRKHDLQFDRNGSAAQLAGAHAQGRHAPSRSPAS